MPKVVDKRNGEKRQLPEHKGWANWSRSENNGTGKRSKTKTGRASETSQQSQSSEPMCTTVAPTATHGIKYEQSNR